MRTGENPAGYTCFDKQEMHALANFKLQCDKNSLNNKSLREAYDACTKMDGGSFWSSTPAIAGYIVIALATGFAAGRK
jgi:hypothetical protein